MLSGASVLDVGVTTLSTVFTQKRILGGSAGPPYPFRIALLKIDVEGSEVDVLRGIGADHWPLIDQVVLETHGHVRRAEVKTMLEEYFSVVGDIEDEELKMSGLERAIVYARGNRAQQQQAGDGAAPPPPPEPPQGRGRGRGRDTFL